MAPDPFLIKQEQILIFLRGFYGRAADVGIDLLMKQFGWTRGDTTPVLDYLFEQEYVTGLKPTSMVGPAYNMLRVTAKGLDYLPKLQSMIAPPPPPPPPPPMASSTTVVVKDSKGVAVATQGSTAHVENREASPQPKQKTPWWAWFTAVGAIAGVIGIVAKALGWW